MRAPRTDDEEEAKRYLEEQVQEIREAVVFGVRRKRTFRETATSTAGTLPTAGISRSALALKDMDPFIQDNGSTAWAENLQALHRSPKGFGAPSKRKPRNANPFR